MNKIIAVLSGLLIVTILCLLMMLQPGKSMGVVVTRSEDNQKAETLKVEEVQQPAPKKEAETEPEPLPEPKWEHVPSDEWPDLLTGKWEGESDSHVSAVFAYKREGSKTPWNVTLGEPKGALIDWYGCGFYESGIAFCRRPDTEERVKGLITVESKADTNGIRFVAFNGEFDYQLVKVAGDGDD